MVEAVMYFYTLYLLTLLTEVTSSIMMNSSESRLVNSVSCRKIVDFVCSIDSDSVSQDDLNLYDIPCPPPHHFMQFCDTKVGHRLTCKIKLYVMRYCYRKYSHMYLAKVCVNCSCDDRCNEVNAFMIQERFLEYTSYQAYSSTTSKSRSSTFSFAISASTTDLSKVSTGIAVTENVTDILMPCTNSTSSNSNGTYIIMTTLEANVQLKNSEKIAFEYFIILTVIFIIEAVVLILIFLYRRKYRQRYAISSNRPEEDADPNICRVSSTGSIILPFIEPRAEHNQDPTVYNVPMDNPVYKGSNSLESESDKNIFHDYDNWRYIDDSRSVSSILLGWIRKQMSSKYVTQNTSQLTRQSMMEIAYDESRSEYQGSSKLLL